LGFRVNGKLAPETENPVPLTASALIVTAAVPVDDRVSVCVVAEFTFTLPNATVEALMASVGMPDPSCSVKVFVLLPALAVSVALCVVVTELTVAVNAALVCPAGIVMEAGTVTDELLLDRLTVNPLPAVTVFNVAVQLSVPAPVMEPLEQVNPASIGMPFPVRLTIFDFASDEFVDSVSEPDTAPAAVGSNCTVNVAVWLGFKVIGRLSAATEKPLPVTVAPLTVTGALPVDVTTTDCVASELTFTDPNATLLVLTLRMGATAPNSSANDCEIPATFAVTATSCAVLTEFTVAVKPALVSPAGTLTEAGTVTAALLLDRLTVSPPLAAAAFNVTVQLSVPAPVMALVAQLTPVGTGIPVPLKVTAVEDPLDASLVTVTCPDSDPAAPGLNCTARL